MKVLVMTIIIQMIIDIVSWKMMILLVREVVVYCRLCFEPVQKLSWTEIQSRGFQYPLWVVISTPSMNLFERNQQL